MPIMCDPESDFSIVLESDKGKDNPPTFRYRPLSAREWKEVGAVYDKMNSGSVTAIGDQIDIIVKAVSIGLIGWENVTDRDGNKIEFDLQQIDTFLTPLEMSTDLMQKILSSGMTEADDKKK